MSLSKVHDLKEAAYKSDTAEAYEALVEEEMAVLSAAHDADQRKAAAVKRQEALKAEIAAARESLEAMQSPLSVKDRERYHREYVRILKEFTERKEVLSFFLSYSVADLKLADLSVVARWLDTWGSFFSEAEQSVKALKRTERTPAAGVSLPPTRVLYDALDEVCRLQLQARSLVGRERYHRATLSEEAVEDIMDSQGQLLTWCRKQIATLEGLSTVEELSAFSVSFAANVPVMASNFLVLMDQCEALADDVRVQEAVEEVNREWIALSLMNYDMLQNALREAHRNGPLEALCNTWVGSVGVRVQDYLACVCSVLTLEKNNTSQAESGRADALLRRCEDLMKDHDSHSIVCAHLASFSIRQDCVQPHLDALKQELVAPATSTVLSFPNYEDYEGRTDYKNRLEELREWIDVKSQKDTYVKLLERLGDTKVMIMEYADALFPDNE